MDEKFYGRWGPAHNSFQLQISSRSIDRTQEITVWREGLVRKYSWSIPNPAAVSFVYEHARGGLVEIGAGTGYWAWQLSQRGLSVVAYDKHPPDQERNGYHNIVTDGRGYRTSEQGEWKARPTFHPVIKAEHEIAAAHPDRTLFLCWPPYDGPMAADALAAYTGNRVIYIGEGDGGCTADDRFHKMLEVDWTEVEVTRPVQWWGIHDLIFVYERNQQE